MEQKKEFLKELAEACTDDAFRVRQTMYSILNSEKTLAKEKEAMVDSIVAKFMGDIMLKNPKIYQLFNLRIGYTDRECIHPAEKSLIYELMSTSLSFPQKENGFSLSPVGHYFKEEDLLEIFDGFDSFAQAISQMNEKSFSAENIIKTFMGPNTRGGSVIELYLVGGQCPITEDKKKHYRDQSKK